jgi:hypothetical protein
MSTGMSTICVSGTAAFLECSVSTDVIEELFVNEDIEVSVAQIWLTSYVLERCPLPNKSGIGSASSSHAVTELGPDDPFRVPLLWMPDFSFLSL